MSHIVIHSFGSLGDMHPYLALALELKRRGHEVVLATAACYREYIECRGLTFRVVRPDCLWLNDSHAMRRFSHLRLGLLRLAREMMLPALRESYDDLLVAAEGADLLLSQIPSAAPRLVAETTGVPWASSVHMPLFFFSGCEVPLLPVAPSLVKRLRFLGPWFWRPMFQASKRATRFVAKPWYDLRRELGLPRASGINALLDSHSPTLVLALFSKLLAVEQPDWPPHTVTTGFPFYDGGPAELGDELRDFLDHGAPPLVFTLGTAVAADAGQFFQHSVAAAQRLGRRAVLAVKHQHNRPTPLPNDVMAVDFAPFSELFRRAEIIVHHGGIGTTGLAMRAGKPMLLVPHAWDQPDNADRVVRLGIGRSVWPRHYTAARAAHELRQLLENDDYHSRAEQVAKAVRLERGAEVACDALERLLPSRGRPA